MSDFRRLAEECLRLARVATKIEDRAVLVDLAARWLDLTAREENTAGLSTQQHGFPSTCS
jgi:hypothetical protein